MAAASFPFVLGLAVFLLLLSPTFSAAGRRHGGRDIVVGGDQHWRFGVNYTAWALNAGPFFVGDTLVFYYQPTVINGITINHNVYKLRTRKQFEACSFGGEAALLAGPTEGKAGYRFKLTQRKANYYFACSIAGGIHCNQGLMKFHVQAL